MFGKINIRSAYVRKNKHKICLFKRISVICDQPFLIFWHQLFYPEYHSYYLKGYIWVYLRLLTRYILKSKHEIWQIAIVAKYIPET